MISVRKAKKDFHTPRGRVTALDGIDLDVAPGEFVLLKGSSGSGKSTLLFLLSGMLRPTEGTVAFEGKDLYALSGSERNRFRAEKVGFLFQLFHLFPYLTVAENVLVGAGTGEEKRSRANELLERLGMTHRLTHKPAQLSAGEQQRVALVRALCNRPPLLLADEPTGNLDDENGDLVIKVLEEYRADGGTIVMATHAGLPETDGRRLFRLDKGKRAEQE